MNKTAIKNFAIYARRKLIESTKDKCRTIGITENKIELPVTHGTDFEVYQSYGVQSTLNMQQMNQRKSLVIEIKNKGFNQVIEEVAYTWFNRLIAVRFMEVNNYLPSRLRVLSSDEDARIESDLMRHPTESDIEFNQEELNYIYDLKEQNDINELFKFLFIKQCNKLNKYLPELFEKTNDYTELLFNISFNDKEDVVYKLVHDIEESNFNVEQEGQVEIIGWMYQYYNSELKDETMAKLKKVKSTKNDIPAITQLFTPDWIVKYMVENSLGRLWYEGHPSNIKNTWKYYIDEAEQEENVQKQLDEIRKEYAKLSIEDIKLLDPCMGSGHILVYAFDVFMQIYVEQGFSERESAKLILENNLYGLEIDKRAYQLSYFALMMKARQYNRRIFNSNVCLHLYEIKEGMNISSTEIFKRCGEQEDIALRLYLSFIYAKEYGSIIEPNVSLEELECLEYKLKDIEKKLDYGTLLDINENKELLDTLYKLISQAKALLTKYDVVVTNPPYMAPTPKQKEFVAKRFPNSKNDLCTIFMEKCKYFSKKNRFFSLITMHSWMFLSSFENLRKEIINKLTIIDMAHLGARAFDEIGGEVVQTTTFVIFHNAIDAYKSTYCRLTEPSSEKVKELMFLNKQNRFAKVSATNFSKIPGSPIAYWLNDKLLNIFLLETKNSLSDYCDLMVAGNKTANNDIYLKVIWEVSNKKIGHKWVKYAKGGPFRRWYGNIDYLIDFSEKAKIFYKNNPTSCLIDKKYWFKSGFTYTDLTSGKFSCRILESDMLFDMSGPGILLNKEYQLYLIALFNCKIVQTYFDTLNSTMHYKLNNLLQIPILMDLNYKEIIDSLCNDSINISKTDWNSFEKSCDLKKHPLLEFIDSFPGLHNSDLDVSLTHLKIVKNNYGLDNYIVDQLPLNAKIENSFQRWEEFTVSQFNLLKKNEEELNRIFIDIYGLQDELNPYVEDKDITIRKADKTRDIKSFISYAVGCMFGRYSLDKEGLVFAGGNFDDVYWLYKGLASLEKDGNSPVDGAYAGMSFEEKHYYKLRDSDNCEEATILSYEPDVDNIIPICDEEYFDDDIVGRFIEFVKVVYGESTLEENLDFIADALNVNGTTSRDKIRNYFIKDFFKDHCQTYSVTGSGKRPIYWLFDSGKQNGFKALIYMHRYNEDTVSKIRTNYLHKIQSAYEEAIKNDEYIIENSKIKSDINKASKHKEKIIKQLEETKLYDQALAHVANKRIKIDLDDGVKHNYELFQNIEIVKEGAKTRKVNLLAKIK